MDIRITLIVSWGNQSQRKELCVSELDDVEITNKKLTNLLDEICTKIGKREEIQMYGRTHAEFLNQKLFPDGRGVYVDEFERKIEDAGFR